MPHNHPPRCCCQPTWTPALAELVPSPGHTTTGRCPSCVEHGKLATLGAECGFRNLNDPDQVCTYTPHGPESRHSWQPDECTCCHTPYGRPHTDYCKAVAPAEYPGQPDRCTYPPALRACTIECDQPSCQMRGQCATEPDPERLVTYPGGEVRPANDPPDPHTCDGRNCGGRPHA